MPLRFPLPPFAFPPSVQTEAELLAVPPLRYRALNDLMSVLLSYLVGE